MDLPHEILGKIAEMSWNGQDDYIPLWFVMDPGLEERLMELEWMYDGN